MEKDLRIITQLIVKEKVGNLTVEETKTLNLWKDNPKNFSIYLEIVDQNNINDRLDFYQKIDQQSSWKTIQSRIKPKAKTLFIQKISRWAAVFILPIVASYLIYQNYDTNKFQKFIDRNVSYDSQAILINDRGETIDLENLDINEFKLSDRVKAINSNNQLTYNITPISKENLEAKEILYTAKTSKHINGEYSFVLSDGTKVWLNSETEFKHPIQFVKDKRIVYLKGEAQFDVAEDKDRPFIVVTEDMNVEVLGTYFNVKTYPKTNITQTTLVEGSVKINTQGDEILLEPGQQAHYSKGDKLEIRNVNTSLFTSWVRGLYTFNNEKLVDITDLLQRWYNVDVFFESELTKDIRFTGAMNKNNPIDELIALMEKTSSVKFSIVENALIISE